METIMKELTFRELEERIEEVQKALFNEMKEERLEELSDELFELECHRDSIYHLHNKGN
jgi:hypothetical protein